MRSESVGIRSEPVGIQRNRSVAAGIESESDLTQSESIGISRNQAEPVGNKRNQSETSEISPNQALGAPQRWAHRLVVFGKYGQTPKQPSSSLIIGIVLHCGQTLNLAREWKVF